MRSVLLLPLRDRAARKRMAGIVAAGVVVGLAYAFLAPKWYRSTLVVVPAKPQRTAAGLSSLLGGGDLGGLASTLTDVVPGADAPRIAAVLQSVSVSDAVIEEFGLRDRYDEDHQEDARKELWKHCQVRVIQKPSLVELSCEDKEPAFVQRMLAFFAEHGNQVFRRVSVSSASEEVRFLERRSEELRRSAEQTAARMREFQERHGVIDIDTQSKAVVSSLASLNAQRISKQLELDYARTFSSDDEATLQQIESQLRVLDRQLRELQRASPAAEGASRNANAPPGVFPRVLDVPKLREEYELLLRNRKVAEATLVVTLERLEGARANEARDVSTFQVLDAPTLPTRKSRPRRLIALAIATFAGALAAAGWERVRAAGGVRSLLGLDAPSDAAGS